VNNGHLGSLSTLDLESRWFKVRVLPEVGAKIYDLVWKPAGRNILWHNPRVAPQIFPIEGEFDNYWCGGWDDAFPTCDACVFRNQHYPDLGELRSVQWKTDFMRQETHAMTARLSAYGPISPVQAVKTIVVERGAPIVRVRYEITNLGPMDVDYLWGTHPAVAITPGTILRIPARQGVVWQCNDPAYGEPGRQYDWPVLEVKGRTIRMDQVQSGDASLYFGHYAVDLEAGWFAIEDTQSGEGFLAAFPLDQCPCLWLWLNYGGWRGHYHVIVEPWTGRPVNLAEAYDQNASRRLKPGEVFSVEIKVTAYSRPDTWNEALARLNSTTSSG
jgi:Domain of unknown function (DUF5107)